MFAKHYLLRGLLLFIGLYHITVGILANTNEQTIVWVASQVTGSSIKPTEQLLWIAKPFGVYVIAFGILMGLAAWNPVKNRAFISVGVVLFMARALQRFVFANEFETMFNVTHQRNLVSIGIVSAFALALLILRLRLHVEIKRQGLPDAERAAG